MDSTPITVNYVPDGDDWTVTVTVTAGGEQQTAQAPGLIAARDRADQIVDKQGPAAAGRTVVHLLEGDAFAFTTAYLHARHGLTPPGGGDQDSQQPQQPHHPNTEPVPVQELAENSDTAAPPDQPAPDRAAEAAHHSG